MYSLAVVNTRVNSSFIQKAYTIAAQRIHKQQPLQVYKEDVLFPLGAHVVAIDTVVGKGINQFHPYRMEPWTLSWEGDTSIVSA